jgi:hypothetical protein
MTTLKSLALCALIAAAATPLLGPARAQTSGADPKATADAIQTIVDQQKTINDNEDKIDAKIADIADNVRVARLFSSRAR